MIKFKKSNGITLIALIVTIIILLILAGIAISQLSDSGLFGKTKIAGEQNKKAQALEEMKLRINEVQLQTSGQAKLKDLVKLLSEDTENSYLVTTNSKIASLAEGSIGLADITDSTEAIYVTNSKYGCEVRVSNKLEVSVTGTVATTNKEPAGTTDYTITYVLNGGTNNSNNPSSYTSSSNAITLQAPTKSGCVFKGWTSSDIVTPQKTVTIAQGSTGNKTYTANWYTTATNPVPSQQIDNRFKLEKAWSFSNGGAYNAFDENTSTYAETTEPGDDAIGSAIGWDFETSVYVIAVNGKIRMKGYKIQYSDDSTTWTDVITNTSNGSKDGDNFSDAISNYEEIGPHRYWRLYVNGGQDDEDYKANVYELKFTYLQ